MVAMGQEALDPDRNSSERRTRSSLIAHSTPGIMKEIIGRSLGA
jgi:hypothetical protein